VLGEPCEPVPGDPVPGAPVPGDPVPEPVPDPEPLPVPCAKTKAGISADNNMASTIFFMMYVSFRSVADV
jgi:hypothetical protein